MAQKNNNIKTHTDSQKDGLSGYNTLDKINLDYDYNTEYGDGDVPDIDKPAQTGDKVNDCK